MSLRISNPLLASALLLAACSGGEGADATPGKLIECAPDGREVFGSYCTMEIVPVGNDVMVVVWNPDSSFHRLRPTHDENWLEEVDGADRAIVGYEGGVITVHIGDDRYILPSEPFEPAPHE